MSQAAPADIVRPPNSGSLLDTARPGPPPIPPADPDMIRVPAEARREPVNAPPLTFRPQGFHFIGNTVISTEALNALLAPDVFREVDMNGLYDIADKVKAYYRERGYFLAVTFLPKQNISDGAVTIGILEGRLGRIIVKTPLPPQARITEKQVTDLVHAYLKEGDIITEKSVEEPLLLLRDMPGAAIRSTLNPGQATGTADLTVEVLPESVKRVSGNVQYDNFGNEFAGKSRLSAQVNLISPLGIGDALSVQGFFSEHALTKYGSVSYVLPVTALGTRAGFSYSRLQYRLGGEFQDLDAFGSADVYSLFALHPLVRSKNFNLFGQASLNYKRLDDNQGGDLLQDRKSLVGGRLQLNGDSRDTGYINVFSAGLEYGRLSISDATQQDIDSGPFGFKTQGSSFKLDYSVQRLQQLVPNLALFLNSEGQWANKNQTSAEKFFLGGPTRVRGYSVGEAAGDNGAVGTVELRYSVPGLHLGSTGVVLTSFFDAGFIQRNAKVSDAPDFDRAEPNDRTLTSYGIGMNIGAPENYLIRASVAWPGAGRQDDESHSPQFWLQLTKFY